MATSTLHEHQIPCKNLTSCTTSVYCLTGDSGTLGGRTEDCNDKCCKLRTFKVTGHIC